MTDKEYIEREAAKNAIFDYICGHTMSKFPSKELLIASKKGAEGAFNELDYVPIADVAEVKHGEWVQRLRPYEDEIHCTVCEAVFNVIDNCTEKFDYCPHCGAKMDGSKHDN